ncbi:calcium signal-modulating cyclophilin ligand-like isoform X2 [Limulus polyphemus]|uniref:Calcium signal-modulating cyclophilin ligand-like isoform X2 n=1 Tax=Limulus polyphemus TaxID=6850 RepID=A0ABM1B798_LIMPO|nr:calcium signal-modulating cyclophilin ligand-like isoform X2 [Limulus polyphemus]
MANIDDVARRREIRRRKILENSEARWQKILDYERSTSKEKCMNISDEHEPSQEQPFKLSDQLYSAERRNGSSKTDFNLISDASSNPTDLNKQVQQEDSVSPDNSDWPKSYVVATSEVHADRTNLSSSNCKSSLPFLSTGNHTSNGTLRKRSTASNAFPKKVSDAESRNYSRSKADRRRRSSCTQLVWDTLQLSSLSISSLRALLMLILAGIISFLLLAFRNLPLCQSVFVPFTLVELMIYVYCYIKGSFKAASRTTSASLITAALILCGVSSSIISKTSICLNILQDVSTDFAVYFFTFLVMHVLFLDWLC